MLDSVLGHIRKLWVVLKIYYGRRILRVKSKVDSIIQNHTWELVDLPLDNKHLGYKWIFKRKMKQDVLIDKYKARLVMK